MFKLFFTCPHCGRPIVKKEKIKEYAAEGAKYCGQCGKEIASTLAEALAQEKGKH